MNAALILDSYGGPRVPYGSLSDAVFSTPGGGFVTVTNAATLRDPVASKVATVAWFSLPRVASGPNTGYHGPVRISVTGPTRMWSGNAWALVNTTLPAHTRVEQAWGATPGTPAAVGGPFLEPMRGIQRSLAFSLQAQAAPGYLGGVLTATNSTLQLDFYLPFGRGEFTVGRLFIGAMVRLGAVLSSERNLGAVDYAPDGRAVSGATARRSRGVARTRDLILEPNTPNPTLATDGGTALGLPVFLDLVGTNSHVVLAAGAVNALPRGDGAECIHGLFRGQVELAGGRANRQSSRLRFVETF